MGSAFKKIGDIRTNSECKSSCCNVEKSYTLYHCKSCGHIKKIYSSSIIQHEPDQ
jgi:hypothetical protein